MMCIYIICVYMYNIKYYMYIYDLQGVTDHAADVWLSLIASGMMNKYQCRC